MEKKAAKKSNGNVSKTVVRQVVKEELRHVDKRLDHVDKRFDQIDQKFEQLDGKIDNRFRQYRDDVLTKMDEVVGELKANREEQATESMLREELEERVDALEAIHPQGQHPK